MPFFFGDKYTIYKYGSNPRGRNLTDEQHNSILYDGIKGASLRDAAANRYIGKDGLYHYDLCKAKSGTGNVTLWPLNLTTTSPFISAANAAAAAKLLTTTSDGELACTRENAESWPFYVFIAAQFCLSLGIAPLFSLGISYLCDNLDEKFHAFYTGKLFFKRIAKVFSLLSSLLFFFFFFYLLTNNLINKLINNLTLH
jgi:hypothetical protein